MVGLKYFRAAHKGQWLLPKLKDLKREIKWAWQRAWEGFDVYSTYDIANSFREEMIHRLTFFKTIKVWRNDYVSNSLHTSEEWDAIIDCLIFHLKWSDADYVEEITNKCYPAAYNIAKQNRKAALNLLYEVYDHLWW